MYKTFPFHKFKMLKFKKHTHTKWMQIFKRKVHIQSARQPAPGHICNCTHVSQMQNKSLAPNIQSWLNVRIPHRPLRILEMRPQTQIYWSSIPRLLFLKSTMENPDAHVHWRNRPGPAALKQGVALSEVSPIPLRRNLVYILTETVCFLRYYLCISCSKQGVWVG